MSPFKQLSLSMTVLAAGASAAAAQCCTPTPAPVTTYRPAAVAPTVAVTPGWYPGRMFDRWAANRAATRSALATAPYTTNYPYAANYATASYRPVVPNSAQSVYSPVQVYRPFWPVRTTAVYSPVVYQPTVSTTSSCCTVPASTTSSCCSVGTSSVVTSSGSRSCCGVDSGVIQSDYMSPSGETTVPGFAPNEPTPAEVPGYRSEKPGAEGEDSSSDPGAFIMPPQNVPQDLTASLERSIVQPAVYRKPVTTQPVKTVRKATRVQSGESRVERDAIGWESVPEGE